MKPGRLYLKIFLSFVIFLIITEAAIFGFFILVAGRYDRERFINKNQEKVAVASQLIEKEVGASELPVSVHHQPLKELLESLGIALRAKIWLTTEDGHLLLKSFPEPIPEHLVTKVQQRLEESRNSRFFKGPSHYFNTYSKTRHTTPSGQQLTQHILLIDHLPSRNWLGVAVGLAGIGLIAALLVIPISRQISRPVKSLTASAAMIEKGDLSHRANITTRDEIGELGKAFNSMAEKVESMIKGSRELTAQISHQLRSPLARMQLSVELMKDRLPDETDAEHLEEVQEDIEELDFLIGRILDLSKLDLHETDYSINRFSPVSELENCLRKSKSRMEVKGVQLLINMPDRQEIRGNCDAFSTALENIVDNAVKYTPDGGHIKASSDKRDGYLILSLANNAPEIPETDLGLIFDPFFRLDPESSNGIGLGLAISRRIIEKHGGTITADHANDMIRLEISLPIFS